jgi:hypothetical protein
MHGPRNVVDGSGGRDESSSVERDRAIYRLELAMHLPGHTFQPTSCKGKDTSSQFWNIYEGKCEWPDALDVFQEAVGVPC